MKVTKWLDEHFEEMLLCCFLIFIACVTLLQILCRTFAKSLPWPEEFSRYCWVWSVFLSLPYTIKKGNMLRVNVLIDLLPTKLRNAINIIVHIIITACMALFFNSTFVVLKTSVKSGRTSPAMMLPMTLVYICFVIGFGLGSVRGIQQIIVYIKNFNKKELTTLEQAMADAAAEATAAKADGTLEGGRP